MSYILTAAVLLFLSMAAQTDTLIQAFLAAYFGNATNYKYMCISTEVSSQTLSSALTAGATITAIPITGATFAIPAGQVFLDWNGSGVPPSQTTPQETLTTAGCAAGATSLPVTSFVLVNNHAIGAKVVPVAPVTDNPSASPAGAQYQTLVAGDFSSVSGSGTGNRTIVATKKFPGNTTVAGSYTAVRLSNTNPIVAGSVGVTSFVPPAVINGSTDQTMTTTIKE